MEKDLIIPKFANETEEAKWWFEHQDILLEQFKTAEAEGRLEVGLAKRRAEARIPTTTIRLDPADIAKARRVAEKKGLKYQTYLKMLIHEALEKEVNAA
jgi:predicted DNA binding CopG/RHH family protein